MLQEAILGHAELGILELHLDLPHECRNSRTWRATAFLGASERTGSEEKQPYGILNTADDGLTSCVTPATDRFFNSVDFFFLPKKHNLKLG